MTFRRLLLYFVWYDDCACCFADFWWVFVCGYCFDCCDDDDGDHDDGHDQVALDQNHQIVLHGFQLRKL